MKVDKDWKAALNTNGTFFDICYSYVRHNPKKGERVVPVVVISAADWEIEQARVAALEADAARMDWIEKNARTDPKMDGNHVFWPTTLNKALRGANLRAAIDAAMKGGA